MRIDDRQAGDVLVLMVRERRLDARGAPELKAALAGYVGRGFEWLVLDLSEVEFVDSSALGAVVSGLKLLGRRGDLVISGAREPVRALFALTRMDRVFRMFDRIEEAEHALASRA